MTVKELKKKLEAFPDNMEVFMSERKTEFAYGLLNTVRSDEINFKEDPYDEEVLARDTVVILDEE